MSVDITMTAGNGAGIVKLTGSDVSSLMTALADMSNDQKYRCDLVILADGSNKVFRGNVDGLFSTAVATDSSNLVQYFFNPDTPTPSCYKRQVPISGGSATDTSITITSWEILYNADLLTTENRYPAENVSFDNSGTTLSSSNVQDAIEEVNSDIKDLTIWSNAVSCAVGATSCTITNANILTTSVVEVYNQNASGTPISINTITITTGQAVIAFDALTEATEFKLHIINP